MLDPQASRFWQAALLSGLMDVEGLTACWDALPPAKRRAPEHLDRRLARQAVLSKALTLWQAQQLLAGRTSGFKVDRYLLLDLIGQGGMGRVYLARDTRLNRRVALKILSPERINNPRAIARFQREARVGAQLQHENLVRVYDFGESNGRYYLVMEYIEGKTIGTLIAEQGPMPPATAARLVRQVALGLGHAHRKGLIHRDVNPYNILVTHDGIAKLADLGLAIDLTESDRVTREGATVGTFDYVAPEQARHSHAADIRSDIYSLGCTLYHMLAGQVPFPSPSLPEKLFAHQALEPTPLDQLVPGLPEGLAEVVRRMMRKGPDERYATPTLLAQALEPYTDEYAAISGRADAGRPLPGPRPETEPGDPSGAALAGAPTVHSSASPAPRSEEIEAGAAPRIAAAAGILPRSGGDLPHSAALSPGGAGLDQPEVPLLTPVDEPAVPLLTPIDETDATSQDVPLNVDLGPEPSLSAGMARSKPRFLSVFPLGTGSVFLPGEPGSNSSTAEGPAWWPAAGWLWGLIVLAALATVVIVLYGLAGALRPTAPVAPESRTRHEAGSDRARAAAADRPSRSGGAPPAILLRTPGREEDPAEEGIPAEDPIQAIRTAISSGRYVELRNREPLRLPPGQTLNFESASGSLIIRAARGCTPVLDIELNGSRPLVTTGSNVSVELSGLTILVRYPRSGAGSAPAPPPVIRSAGKRTKIERCAFAVAGRAGCHDSCAIVADGGSLLVNRCWLQGFDRAIEVSAYLGALARIHQTMIVPAPARPLTMGGWSVTVKALGSGGAGTRTPQRLILDHCTVEAAGLLDLAGGPSPPDLEVEVKHCAIRTAALVAWKRNPLATGQVRWFGEGNQYDIRGRAWIVPAAGSGPVTATSPTDVTDLESWSKVAARESQPIRTTLVYRTDPAARADPLRPRDFAIADLGSASTAVGADPDQVGPWGR